MTRRQKKILKKLMPYVLVTVLAILVIVGVLIFTEDQNKEIAETTTPGTPIADTDINSETSVSTENDVETNEFATASAIDILNVNDLIDRYYDAKINDDADTLNSIVESDKPYTVAELANESQYIFKYDNFTTYVIPGITEDYFLVYVKYDIFFNGINKGAAALNHFIVVKDSDGFYYIYDKEISGEFDSYIQNTENSETVTALKTQVEDELAAARAENSDLDYLIKVLTGEEVITTTAAETTTTAETTAEETEASEETSSSDGQ